MSDQAENRTTGDLSQPTTSCVPETKTSCRNAVPQDFDSLKEWFDSSEFLQKLTNGFWDAKKQAIAERDRLRESEQVNESKS